MRITTSKACCRWPQRRARRHDGDPCAERVRCFRHGPRRADAAHDGVRVDTETDHPTIGGQFLSLLTGKEPSEEHARALDVSLILYAEHGFNASTFTARTCASTLSDMHSCVTGAIGTLRGPLHGGANEAAMEMIEQYSTREEAKAGVLDLLAKKEKIMGFGHAVYSTEDPRNAIIKIWAEKLSKLDGNTTLYEVSEEIEKVMDEDDDESEPLLKSLEENPIKVVIASEEEQPIKETSLFVGQGNVQVDVHTARGMDCIDCHTQRDIMGDGNLYSKQHQAVEIRCETCHGDDNSYPLVSQVIDPKDAVIRLSKHYRGMPNSVGDSMAVSERKKRMANVKVQNGKMVTLGKRSGRVYDIPLVRDAEAHFIPQHRSRLECTACHSQWVVRCPGCHLSMNLGQDKLDFKITSPMQVQQPTLMIGPRGKVAPMLAQPERHFSLLDEKGNPIPVLGPAGKHYGEYKEWTFTNPHNTSGSNLAYSLNPHSTGTKVRSCESCHLSPKTLGLGEGNLRIGANNTGKNDSLIPLNHSDERVKASKFDPEAKVSMRGESLAGSHQLNARPFNQKEIVRILKVGNCIPCHDQYDDPIYQDIKKSYAFAGTMKHRKLREKILNLDQTQP